jgi:1-acyl-sn-glycerol-3-phosphate acyltransferase
LIVSNHTGPWETVAFMPLVPGDMTYVLKRQLIGWKYNFFALGLRSLKPIPISREANSGDFNTMQRLSAEHFVQKRSVLIFPGGTRKALSESLSFGPGGVLLARKLKCRILPVFVDSECWSRGRWFKDYGMLYPGAIRVHFGEPIPPGEVEQTKSRVLHERILSFMKQCAEEEKNRTPDRNDPGTGEDGAASPA